MQPLCLAWLRGCTNLPNPTASRQCMKILWTVHIGDGCRGQGLPIWWHKRHYLHLRCDSWFLESWTGHEWNSILSHLQIDHRCKRGQESVRGRRFKAFKFASFSCRYGCVWRRITNLVHMYDNKQEHLPIECFNSFPHLVSSVQQKLVIAGAGSAYYLDSFVVFGGWDATSNQLDKRSH